MAFHLSLVIAYCVEWQRGEDLHPAIEVEGHVIEPNLIED